MIMKGNALKTVSLLTLIAMLVLIVGSQPAAAGAQVVTTRQKYPVEYSLWHYCYGEWVHWTGYIQWVSHVTIDENGGAHTAYHGHSHLAGVSESGVKYVGHWNNNLIWNDRAPGPWEHTETWHTHTVSQGSGARSLGHQTWHVTINANGDVTAEVENVRFDCK